MEYRDYIRAISFRLYKPHMNPRGFTRVSELLRRFNLSLEILNTHLPENSSTMANKLFELCSIPRMSTYAIAAMINKAVLLMPSDMCFVNVGVWNGFTFLAGLVGNSEKRCIGVDNFSEFGGPREQFHERFNRHKSVNHHFYDMDYVNYFEKIHKGLIGVYIYDGEHSYQNQLKGLQLAEPFFANGSLVLVDDTNWQEPKQATLDFISNSSHKYEILFDESTFRDRHPTLWNGLMVFRRISDCQ